MEQSPSNSSVVMQHILRSMGVQEYEPHVITQLLEILHREQRLFVQVSAPLNNALAGFSVTIIEDANDFSRHAQRKVRTQRMVIACCHGVDNFLSRGTDHWASRPAAGSPFLRELHLHQVTLPRGTGNEIVGFWVR
jgi:histone H3/H4